MNKFLKGFLCVIGAVFAWSSLEVTASYIFAEGVGPVTMLNIRFLIAAALFGTTILIQNKRTGENLFLVKREDISRFWLNGFLLALHLVVYWYAWEILDPNLPVIYAIFYMYPFITALVAIYYYGEKFNKNRKIALGLGTLGALFAIEFLPTFSTEGLRLDGILLDVAACFTWVGYLLVGQGIMKKYNPLTIVFYDFLACFVYTSLIQAPSVTILYWTAVKNIGATNTGIGELATPIFGVTLGYFFLAWAPSLFQMVGLLMIVSGLYLIYREKEIVYDQ